MHIFFRLHGRDVELSGYSAHMPSQNLVQIILRHLVQLRVLRSRPPKLKNQAFGQIFCEDSRGLQFFQFSQAPLHQSLLITRRLRNVLRIIRKISAVIQASRQIPDQSPLVLAVTAVGKLFHDQAFSGPLLFCPDIPPPVHIVVLFPDLLSAVLAVFAALFIKFLQILHSLFLPVHGCFQKRILQILGLQKCVQLLIRIFQDFQGLDLRP